MFFFFEEHSLTTPLVIAHIREKGKIVFVLQLHGTLFKPYAAAQSTGKGNADSRVLLKGTAVMFQIRMWRALFRLLKSKNGSTFY